MILIYITIALSLFGLLLSTKIFIEKRKPEPVVCLMGTNCEIVVRGQFSSFLGIGLEVFGGIYYLIVLSFYTLLAFIHCISNVWICW